MPFLASAAGPFYFSAEVAVTMILGITAIPLSQSADE
jgi:hypothetical protein